MRKLYTSELKANMFCDDFVFLDEEYPLFVPGEDITSDVLERMAGALVERVLTNGDFAMADVSREAPPAAEKAPLAQPDDELDVVVGLPAGPEGEILRPYVEHYTKFAQYIYSLFVRMREPISPDAEEFSIKEVVDRVKDILGLITNERKYFLRAISFITTQKRFQVYHSARTTVISLIIGHTLKLPYFRLLELGAAAVLHEIGMTKIPDEYYMNEKQLSPEARKTMSAHTIIGFNLLKERGVPLPLSVVALEHHERMNGAGYPRKLVGEAITLYSRIVMVACSYDSMTSKRPYKKETDKSQAVLSLLKNSDKLYDDTVIRALVRSLSIYPIGSYVFLSSKRKGIVIDINPLQPRYPIVQVIGEKGADGKPLVIRTSELTEQVERSLTQAEIDATPQV